ncbi:MAG: LD-carboxypeptidase [Alphaproteobacteria bacterium]|nr:LD-carboxypeptidase [Alphaproteobacteria bacterium]
MIPDRLKKGDKVMIIAPSRSLKLIKEDCRKIAEERLKSLGLEVVFAPNTTDENCDLTISTDVKKRVDDIHTAFADKSVKAILTVIGGFNSNQLIKHLDYDLIKNNPKIFMGFSDITALHTALYAKTGLVTYYGPHYSSLGMLKGCEYTFENMVKTLFEGHKQELKASDEWSDDMWFLDQQNRKFIANNGWWHIQKGEAKGTIIGGNLCTFILHLGTPYRPSFKENTILFLEDDEMSDLLTFERNLQALINQDDFKNVKGLVIGRFQNKSNVTREKLEFILKNKPALANMPIIANIDMGHTTPIATIPLGGEAEITLEGKILLK